MNKRIFSYLDIFKDNKISSKRLAEGLKKSGGLGPIALEFKTLLYMLQDIKNKKYSINKVDLCTIVGIVAYVVSPIDSIPDILPVLGFTDDTALVVWGIKKFHDIIFEYKVWKNYKEN